MLIIHDTCDQCASCISVCTVNALHMRELNIKVDHETCVACGLCVKICPVGALELQNAK